MRRSSRKENTRRFTVTRSWLGGSCSVRGDSYRRVTLTNVWYIEAEEKWHIWERAVAWSCGAHYKNYSPPDANLVIQLRSQNFSREKWIWNLTVSYTCSRTVFENIFVVDYHMNLNAPFRRDGRAHGGKSRVLIEFIQLSRNWVERVLRMDMQPQRKKYPHTYLAWNGEEHMIRKLYTPLSMWSHETNVFLYARKFLIPHGRRITKAILSAHLENLIWLDAVARTDSYSTEILLRINVYLHILTLQCDKKRLNHFCSEA